VRAEGARCAYIQGARKGEIVFFADSERFELRGKAAQLAMLVANQIAVPIQKVSPLLTDKAAMELLGQLMQRGLVVAE
jgi:hypothetical protein